MRGYPQDQNFIHVASTSRIHITLRTRTAERNDTHESMYVLFLLAVHVSNALRPLLRQVQIAALCNEHLLQPTRHKTGCCHRRLGYDEAKIRNPQPKWQNNEACQNQMND